VADHPTQASLMQAASVCREARLPRKLKAHHLGELVRATKACSWSCYRSRILRRTLQKSPR